LLIGDFRECGLPTDIVDCRFALAGCRRVATRSGCAPAFPAARDHGSAGSCV